MVGFDAVPGGEAVVGFESRRFWLWLWFRGGFGGCGGDHLFDGWLGDNGLFDLCWFGGGEVTAGREENKGTEKKAQADIHHKKWRLTFVDD